MTISMIINYHTRSDSQYEYQYHNDTDSVAFLYNY